MARTMSAVQIVTAASRVLGERGPLAPEPLAQALAGLGVRSDGPGNGLLAPLETDPRFLRLDDDRWAYLPALLDGAVLTHRLGKDEVEAGAVRLDPDLTPLAPLLGGEDGLALAAGGRLRRGPGAWELAAGPAGWLEGAEAGTLLGFRLRGERLEVGTLSENDLRGGLAGKQLTAAARDRLADLAPLFDQPVAHVGRLVAELLARAPRLLESPAGPIGELLNGSGLAVHGALAGRPGTDWSAWSAEPGRSHEAHPSGTAGDDARRSHPVGKGPGLGRSPSRPPALDETAREALELIVGGIALASTGWEPAPGEAAGLAGALSLPGVAEALSDQAGQDPEMERFLTVVEAAAEGATAAAARFLLAVCAEGRGDRAGAEAGLGRSLDADPGYTPALLRAARYAGERGDTDGVLALLARAGVELTPAERRRLARFGRDN
jgi:hypothetical protein